MSKTSIVVQFAGVAVMAAIAAMPAGANAPSKPAPSHPQVVTVKATATPTPRTTPNPFPTCGPPVNVIERINTMNPFVVHCPV